MPFYAQLNGYWTRLNLRNASTLYSPSDSSGKNCNLTSTGTATPFYANGTRIYTSATWSTVWTGSQPINGTLGVDYTTAISGITFPSSPVTYRITVLRQTSATQVITQSALPVNVSGTVGGISYSVQIKSFSANTWAGTFLVVSQLTQGAASGATIQKIEVFA